MEKGENMKIKYLAKIVMCIMLPGVYLMATPSTQIWNPSTDIQAGGTFHLGIDNYFSIENNQNKPYAFGTDIGLSYGLMQNLEIGIDVIDPSINPLYFNLKYGFAETGGFPAIAAGIFNAGTNADSTGYNILYVVTAKTFDPLGRFSLGYYCGNDKLLVTETGTAANTGLIVSWDKIISDKIWLSVDFASGMSLYGSLSFGGSYMLSSNTSIIFGYVIFNNNFLNTNNTFTVQMDINL